MKGFSKSARSPLNEEQVEEKKRLLNEYLVRHQHDLLISIGVYARQAGVGRTRESIAEKAVEIFQDTVVEALKYAYSYDPTLATRSWLLKIALHLVAKKQKQAAQERAIMLPVGDVPAVQKALQEAAELSEDEMFAIASDCGALYRRNRAYSTREILSVTNDKERHALRLRYVEGLEAIEIAASLGVSEGNAQTILCRARKRVRQAFQ